MQYLMYDFTAWLKNVYPWYNNIAHFQETYVRFDMDFEQV